MVTVVPEVEIMFERDAEGNLVLDENGDPIAYVRGSLEAPINFERDAEGNLVLNENGDPAIYIVVEATAVATPEPTVTPEPTPIPVERSIDVWMTAEREPVYYGDTITLHSALNGYDGVEATLQWMCDRGNGWEDVGGANSADYSFTLTEENVDWLWRLDVTTPEE